jgi:hypothetical protein
MTARKLPRYGMKLEIKIQMQCCLEDNGSGTMAGLVAKSLNTIGSEG